MSEYNRTPELSVSSVFGLRPEELELFFLRDHLRKPDNYGEVRESLKILDKVGGYNGLLHFVSSCKETGIIGDVKDIARRKKFFGKNYKRIPRIHSYLSILLEKFEDEFIRILLVLGVVSLVLSIFFKTFPYEAMSIFFAVGLSALVASLCDYGKEQ